MLEPASSLHDACVRLFDYFGYVVLLRVRGVAVDGSTGVDDRPIRANAFERARTPPDATHSRGDARARLARSRSHAVEGEVSGGRHSQSESPRLRVKKRKSRRRCSSDAMKASGVKSPRR